MFCVSDYRSFKEKLSSPCRLKPPTLNVCHIVCIYKILLYKFKFKYFVLLLVILKIFVCHWLHVFEDSNVGNMSSVMHINFLLYIFNLLSYADLLFHRLNEAVMHFGESIKEIINEEFGDGM